MRAGGSFWDGRNRRVEHIGGACCLPEDRTELGFVAAKRGRSPKLRLVAQQYDTIPKCLFLYESQICFVNAFEQGFTLSENDWHNN